MHSITLLAPVLLISASATRAAEHRAATNLFALAQQADCILEARVLETSPGGWLHLVCEEPIRAARRAELLALRLPRRITHTACSECFEPGLHYLLFLRRGPSGRWFPLGGTRGVIPVQPHLSAELCSLRVWENEDTTARIEHLLELASGAQGRLAEDAAWALCQRARDLRADQSARLLARLRGAPPRALACALLEALAANSNEVSSAGLLDYALGAPDPLPNLQRLARILAAHHGILEARIRAEIAAHPQADPHLLARWKELLRLMRTGAGAESPPGGSGGQR